MQQQPSPLSNKISKHDTGPLSDYNPLQPQQQPSFQSNRPTMTPVPYDSGNIESPALPPTDNGTFKATTSLGRKPSIVEGLLTSAATAASTAVEAARSLVSHEDILAEEAKDIKDPSSSSTASTSLFPSLGSESHHGLEFKQRRLSSDKVKKDVAAMTQKPRAHGLDEIAVIEVSQWLEATKAENEIECQKKAASKKSHLEGSIVIDSKDNLPVGSLSDGGGRVNNGTGSTPNASQGASVDSNVNNGAGSISANVNANNGKGGASEISAALGSDSGINPRSNANANANANANVGQANNDIPPRAGTPIPNNTTNPVRSNSHSSSIRQNLSNPVRSNSQSSSIRLNTIYVTGQGPESVRHGGMGVDQPAISSSYQHHHRNSSSGMGVDLPLLVGQPRDPKEHRKGALQVDAKHPDDTHHHEVHQPHDPKEEAKATAVALGSTPATGRGAVSGKGRRGSASGLNVDQPPAPSKLLAGNGSNETTLKSGSYNSGINVDKAGSGDFKRSGMGVDGPALSSYHMASTHDPHLLVSGRDNNCNTTTNNVDTEEEVMKPMFNTDQDGTRFVETRGSGFGEGGTIHVNRYSASSQAPLPPGKTTTSTTMNQSLEVGSSSHMPQTIDNTAGHIVTEVPADYHGPLPQVAPGEQVMWVKKVIQTDYYEDGEPSTENNNLKKRSSISKFVDRLRGRNSNYNNVEKGKQRT
ncbi:hypothetical protein CPC16_009653 [Podila verticillata]|nr:hypothetical protein CPC16_009653 [Podila verticillata]